MNTTKPVLIIRQADTFSLHRFCEEMLQKREERSSSLGRSKSHVYGERIA